MKISKNTSRASVASTPKKSVTSSSRADAQQHIRAAIDCLGKEAKADTIAKESIANLSVVLLDLQ